tara:strand:- start:191 stop:775 length:585 start_codon:yes stop_codon:yes gene_type:complete
MKIYCLNSKELSRELKNGSAAIFPTDTLPALGICPEHASKLWHIKKRPLNKPLILMGSKKEQFYEYVQPSAFDDASEMIEKYWPGALTIVLPAKGKEAALLNPTRNTIGIRIPANDLAIDLIDQIGPLATTSANLSGTLPLLTAEEASKSFPEIPLLGPVPWPKSSAIASTVISWESRGKWQLLRKGAVTSVNI